MTNEQTVADYIKEKGIGSISPEWVLWALELIEKSNRLNAQLNPAWFRAHPIMLITPTGNVFDSEPPISGPPPMVPRPKAEHCHVCGETAMPMITVQGPNYPEPGKGTRHFCCVACFWKWTNRVIADRDRGGSLGRQINWD